MQSKTLVLPGINGGQPVVIWYETDRFIREVLEQGEYVPLFKKTGLDSNLVVMDLGCNIGTFSIYIYDHASMIYAIDLGTYCIELFDKTIEANKFTKIKTFCQAISGESKRVKLTGSITETNGSQSILNGAMDEMDSVSLATFIKSNNIDHIDLLKIDVEGAESEIFNAPDFKDIKDRIYIIIGELHAGNTVDLTRDGFSYSTEPGGHFIAINQTYGHNTTANS
jgi:FkbM family methyltransferase